MSCTNITTCFRIGTDYKDRLITPTDGLGGLSDFRYEIKDHLGGLVRNLTVGAGLEIVGDKIVIQGDALEDLPVGKYDAVFWLDINGQTRDLFSEDLEISADKCDCQNLYNLAFTIIPVDIEENVVNIYLSWEDLTPEQILELQQPAIDAGNEVRQQVDEYIEAKELQINPVILAAENATQNANDAAQTANTAAQNADEKATAAQTAANNANDATSAANTATTNANNATLAANTATTNANNATLAANTAAENAQDEADAAQQINTDVQLAENTRISNENTRQNQESTRQTNETGRINAESARVLAENSRVSAESARVTAFATAVTNANNAAEFANSQRGWQPLLVADTTTIAGKTLLKLQDWIGGTGTKPTTNVGQWQTAAGGYTATAADALDLNAVVTGNVVNKVADLEWANKNLNVFTLTGRYYYLPNGGLVTNASYNSTPLYRVKEGMKFKNPFMGEGGVAQAVFFKSDNTFLSAIQGQSEITAPAGAFFVGFSRPASSTETIKVQTDFWAMQQDNMVVRYVQAGNKEVTVTSNTGNVLNAVGHGFVNGDRVILSLIATPTNNEIVSIVGRVPILSTIPVGTANGDVGYYVVNATTDTFQLSATSGGAALSVNANPNFTAFKFEKVATALLTFRGLPASNNYKILISGGCYRLPQYAHPNYTSSNGAKVNTTGTAISSGGLRINASAVVADGVITIASGKSGFFLTQEYKALTADATGNLVTAIVNDTIFHFSDKRDITQIDLADVGLSNGSVIKIIRE